MVGKRFLSTKDRMPIDVFTETKKKKKEVLDDSLDFFDRRSSLGHNLVNRTLFKKRVMFCLTIS